MEPLGIKVRRQRLKLGLTQSQLAVRTGISKPYLSLIENGNVANPPADEKLRRLERALGFDPDELVSQAHLQRIPGDVRAVLQKLVVDQGVARAALPEKSDAEPSNVGRSANRDTSRGRSPGASLGINLDDAYLSGVLQQMLHLVTPNVEMIRAHSVPVINRVSAGYPSDFTDLSYPPRVADEYVGCPEVNDRDAFAARVHGDSMMPKYRQGDIVIFSPGADPREGDDCFVRFEDGQTTFKRIFFETDSAGEPMLRLQPRNEKYRAQVIPAERVNGLYKALYKYQRVDDE